MVQLREKHCTTREFLEEARALKALLAPLGVPLIINDRIDIALAVNADGAHVGQTDMPVDAARAMGWLQVSAFTQASTDGSRTARVQGASATGKFHGEAALKGQSAGVREVGNGGASSGGCGRRWAARLESVVGLDYTLPGTDGALRLCGWWSPGRREAMCEIRLL